MGSVVSDDERYDVAVVGGGGAGLDTSEPSISAQGHRVAFQSSAATLVSGDANNTQDVFARAR